LFRHRLIKYATIFVNGKDTDSKMLQLISFHDIQPVRGKIVVSHFKTTDSSTAISLKR